MKRLLLPLGVLCSLMVAQVFAAACTDAELAPGVYGSLKQGMTLAQTLSILKCDSVRLTNETQSPGVTVQGYQWNSPNRTITVTFRMVNGGQATLFTKELSGLLSDAATFSPSDSVLALPKLSLDGTTNYRDARLFLPTGGNWSYLGAGSSSPGLPDSSTSLFTSASGTLLVPSLTVDGAAFTNVWLYLPPSKPWSVLAVGTLTQPPLPTLSATFSTVSGQMVLPDLSVDGTTNYTNARFSLPVGGASWAFQGGENKSTGTPSTTASTFTSASGVLFVPSLIKDGVTVANAWYYLAPGKGWQELGTGTLTQPPLPVISVVAKQQISAYIPNYGGVSDKTIFTTFTKNTDGSFSAPRSWRGKSDCGFTNTALDYYSGVVYDKGTRYWPVTIYFFEQEGYQLTVGGSDKVCGIDEIVGLPPPVTVTHAASFDTATGLMVLPDLSVDGETNYINAKFWLPVGAWGNGNWVFQDWDNKAAGTPSATAATYNTSSGILFVPSLSLNGKTVANAWYLLQPGQPWRDLGAGSITQPAVSTMRSPSSVHIPNYGGISNKSIFMTVSDADGSSAYWRGKSDCSFPAWRDADDLIIITNQPAIIYQLDQEGYLLTIGGSSLICGIEPMTVTP